MIQLVIVAFYVMNTIRVHSIDFSLTVYQHGSCQNGYVDGAWTGTDSRSQNFALASGTSEEMMNSFFTDHDWEIWDTARFMWNVAGGATHACYMVNSGVAWSVPDPRMEPAEQELDTALCPPNQADLFPDIEGTSVNAHVFLSDSDVLTSYYWFMEEREGLGRGGHGAMCLINDVFNAESESQVYSLENIDKVKRYTREAVQILAVGHEAMFNEIQSEWCREKDVLTQGRSAISHAHQLFLDKKQEQGFFTGPDFTIFEPVFSNFDLRVRVSQNNVQSYDNVDPSGLQVNGQLTLLDLLRHAGFTTHGAQTTAYLRILGHGDCGIRKVFTTLGHPIGAHLLPCFLRFCPGTECAIQYTQAQIDQYNEDPDVSSLRTEVQSMSRISREFTCESPFVISVVLDSWRGNVMRQYNRRVNDAVAACNEVANEFTQSFSQVFDESDLSFTERKTLFRDTLFVTSIAQRPLAYCGTVLPPDVSENHNLMVFAWFMPRIVGHMRRRRRLEETTANGRHEFVEKIRTALAEISAMEELEQDLDLGNDTTTKSPESNSNVNFLGLSMTPTVFGFVCAGMGLVVLGILFGVIVFMRKRSDSGHMVVTNYDEWSNEDINSDT